MRTLIIKGVPVPNVRITAGASAPEAYAAAELKTYFGKIGIPVTDASDAYPILTAVDPMLGRDCWRIAVGADEMTVYGGNGRGVIYGVYGLLERCAGVRYFMPDLESLGEGDIVIDGDLAYNAVFEMRQSDWPCGNGNTEWCVKNGINQRAIPQDMGGHIKYGGFVHTMGNLTGVTEPNQPCLSDPEMLSRAIAKVREMLLADPSIKIVSVSQNDNQNYCKCEKCAAVDAEEGSHAGTLLRFVNAVAADIAKDYPDVVIDTLAYQYTRHVPSITRPLPNVCIRLCSIECCFSHPLNDRSCPENNAFYNDILDWNKICDRIYIWDYVTDFSYYIPTFPNFDVLRENMRFFADHGVRGMYPEGNYNSPQSGEFGELRCYLLAKLMQDPYLSTTEYYRHMDEFLAAYYGEGWRYIRAYIDFTCAEAKKIHMKIWEDPFGIIPRETYEAMEDTIERWWQTAEDMAGDRAAAVHRSRFQWRYIRLMLHPDAAEGERYRREVDAANVLWNEWRALPDSVDYTKTPDKWFS